MTARLYHDQRHPLQDNFEIGGWFKEQVTMKLLRLFADDKGESHFDVVEHRMTLLDDSPPAKPHYFTEPQPAKAWISLRCPPDWGGGLHPTPRRQILVCTAGAVRVTSSLGDTRELLPGAAVLLEDTHGKGHISEVTSSASFEALVIRLEQPERV